MKVMLLEKSNGLALQRVDLRSFHGRYLPRPVEPEPRINRGVAENAERLFEVTALRSPRLRG